MAYNLTLLATILYFVLPLGSGRILPTMAAGQQISVESLPTLAGQAVDHIRIAQLLGQASTEGYLLRTPSRLLNQILEDQVYVQQANAVLDAVKEANQEETSRQ